MQQDRTISKFQIYRHYKNGHLYTVLELAIDTHTDEMVVVYGNAGGIYTRSLSEFGAVVSGGEGTSCYRFELVQ